MFTNNLDRATFEAYVKALDEYMQVLSLKESLVSEGEFEDFDIFGEREKSLGANKDRRNDINDWKSIRKDLGVTISETRPYGEKTSQCRSHKV